MFLCTVDLKTTPRTHPFGSFSCHGHCSATSIVFCCFKHLFFDRKVQHHELETTFFCCFETNDSVWTIHHGFTITLTFTSWHITVGDLKHFAPAYMYIYTVYRCFTAPNIFCWFKRGCHICPRQTTSRNWNEIMQNLAHLPFYPCFSGILWKCNPPTNWNFFIVSGDLSGLQKLSWGVLGARSSSYLEDHPM